MVLRGRYVLSGLIAVVMLFCVSGAVPADSPAWSIEGEYFEGCTCNPGCPCLFGSEPTYKKCKISGIFNIHKGKYGEQTLDGQTVVGITDLTATPDSNWIVFYMNKETISDAQKDALLDIFQNHVFGFAKVPPERITVRSLPIHIETSKWRKKVEVADKLTLEVEILRGAGDSARPTQIVNKLFPIWSKEFDATLDMGKAVTHRFKEGDQGWNYDGRSGFATTFKFASE
jgi:hypothetical protein